MSTEVAPVPHVRPAPLVGLTSDEVREREAAGLVNRVAVPPSRTLAEILRANLFTRFNAILGVLLAVIVVVGPFQDALFGIVLAANILIGVVQELRAKRTLDRLALLAAPKAVALRDGRTVELPAEDIVTDDVLRLRAGDQVVVDGVVLASQGLELDESLLSGESDPVPKAPGDELRSGSFAAAGQCWYRATGVGEEAYAVQLAREARRFTLVHSELRAGIDRILRGVTWVMVPTAILLISSQLVHNENLADALRGSVAGVGSMVPEGLVLLTSLAFAVGVVRLGRRRVLVQELPAVEALARVDVLCVDKTGTLTEGVMSVSDVDTLAGSPASARLALGALAAADPSPNATMRAVAEALPAPDGWRAVAVVPFSSARKWSGASFGLHGSWVLGAPEVLLAPRTVADAGSPASARLAARLAARRADAGQRVLLLASAPRGLGDGLALPTRLEPVALVALEDRVRPEAAETLAYFRREGVTLKVLSGDDPRTVGAVARRVDLIGDDSAAPLDARSLPDEPGELAAIMEERTVFGRVTPHQKLAMVEALRSRGHVVAMVGDGVNDVLALKHADLGIALGSGSGASRAVAQLVLLESTFDSLPPVVAEGRRVIGNIERVAKLFLTKTVYATLLALAVGVAQLPFPFLPRHLTVVTALTIGLPAFFLALAPNLARAHRGFARRALTFAVPAGAVAAGVTFLAYAAVRAENMELAESRSTATIVLFAVGFWALTAVARPLTRPRRWLLGLMACSVLGVLTVGPLREFYGLALPPVGGWLTAFGISALGVLALETGWQVVAHWEQRGRWLDRVLDVLNRVPRQRP